MAVEGKPIKSDEGDVVAVEFTRDDPLGDARVTIRINKLGSRWGAEPVTILRGHVTPIAMAKLQEPETSHRTALLKEVEEVLEPFSVMAAAIDKSGQVKDIAQIATFNGFGLHVGDLRLAASLLSRLRAEKSP